MSKEEKPTPLQASWLRAGGEMGRLIHEKDWSDTAVGPMESWPQSLRTSVQIMVDSRYPMFIWWGDELVQFYNDGYAPILGERHPESLGCPASEVWVEIWDVVGPQADRVRSEGQAVHFEELLLIMERHGYKEETYFTYSYSPILDESEKVRGIFCACAEDTKRVLSARRLRTLRELSAATTSVRTTEEFCRAAFEVLERFGHDHPFALLYLLDDEQQVATLAGSAGIHKGKAASPPDIRLGDSSAVWPLARVKADRKAAICDSVSESLKPLPSGPWQDPVTGAAVLPIAASGSDRLAGMLVVGLNPVRARDDEYTGYLDLLADQLSSALAGARFHEEEHRRLEELAKHNQAKTAFFNNVSHEFRTPLTLLIAPLEEELRRLSVDAPERRNLETAHRNSLRLLNLVNTLLDFSRIEAGRAQARYRPTDLGRLTARISSHFQSLMDKAGLKFSVSCSGMGEAVYVDSEMWEKIVLNLISNAFKFTFEGGIEVNLSSQTLPVRGDERDPSSAPPEGGARVAVLEVRDSGIGVPESARSQLFERFYRVEGAQGRSFEGTGIGLALAKELVELHGGRISVESRLDEGSIFRVEIPFGRKHLPAERIGEGATVDEVTDPSFLLEAQRWLQKTAGGEGAKETDFSDGGQDGGRPTIVLADDNADMRDYIGRLLSGLFRVVSVEDGQAALEEIRQARPDLVLADVMMPRLDGFALLRALRDDEETRMVPVILLSAQAGDEAYSEGLRAGADDYLVKPFSAGELLARINARMEISRLRDEAMKNERLLREKAEASLRAKLEAEKDTLRLNKRLTAILENASIGMHWSNENGVILWANEAELQMLGYRRDEYVGHNLREFHLDGERVDEMLSLLKRGERVIDMQARLRAKDGSVRVALIDISGSWEGDSFIHAQGFTRDVTDRENALENLKEAEHRQRQLFQNMPIAIYTCDRDGVITHFNAAAVELWGREPKLGKDLWCGAFKLHYSDGSPLALEDCPMAVALRDGETLRAIEVQVERPDGSIVPVVPYPEVICNTEGEVVGAVNMLVDISSRKKIEESLEQAKRQAEAANVTKSEFLANMSHEIRTPMTAILGYADLLVGNLGDPDDLECVNTIRRNGEYLIEIIDDILDISRIEAGKLEIERLRFSPYQLVGDIHSLMAGRAADKSLDFNVDFETPMPETIDSDPTRLRQILINLVSNAIKFTDEGSVDLRVSLLEQKGKLMFEVVDTGIGISEQKLGELFRPFNQGDTSYARRYGGSGLGLAISLRLAEMLDGEISADSSPGRGSIFSLTVSAGSLKGIPIVGDDQSWRRKQSPRRMSSRRLECRVMIVDDRREVRHLAQYFVEESGAHALTANDGRAAIEKLAAERDAGRSVDVVVLDMQMPELDGYQTARILREEGFDFPIIAMTAHAMSGDEEKCRQAGCDEYLTKPIDRRKLIDTIGKFAESCRGELALPKPDQQRLPAEPVEAVNSASPCTGKPVEGSKLRLLIVEDNAGLRKILKLSFTLRGFEVEAAEGGAEAFKIVEAFRPEAVLIDIGLPDMSGHELVDRLRRDSRNDGIVWVALSGRGEAKDIEKSKRAGFDEHFVKPPDMDELIGFIRERAAAQST